MRPYRVVVPSPSFDHDLRLLERVEDFAIEQLIAQLAVERLAIAVLPGTSWFDVGGLGADGCNPFAERECDELRAVVGTDVGRHAASDEQIAQRLDDICRLQLPGHADGNRFPRELVDDAQHPEGLSIMGAIGHEVVRPHMVGPLRPQADARSVVEPQTPAFGLF